MLKIFLISVSGLGGIAGCASLSSLNLDPKHLWRITNNNRFYLSNCSNFTREGEKTSTWTNSNLWIYLTVKNSGEINEGSKLELWAEGWGERWDNKNITIPRKYENISLQKPLTGTSDSEYELAKTEFGIKLGENSAGESSQLFGDTIKCNDIFDLTSDNFEKNGKYVKLRLDKVTFQLKEIGSGDGNTAELKKKYKGYKVYSIEINNDGDNSNNKKLSWVNDFKPIVVVPSN